MGDETEELIAKLEKILSEYEKEGEGITKEKMQAMLAKMKMIEDEISDPDIKKELAEGVDEFRAMIEEK